MPHRPSLLQVLRYWAYLSLQRLSSRRDGVEAPRRLDLDKPSPAIWFFVSTIGELNAVGGLLDALLARLDADLQLVLLTDRNVSLEPFARRYPRALVVPTSTHADAASRLASECPPVHLLLAEIPCLPHDAPCRLPLGYAFEAQRCGAQLAIVNAWLYDEPPTCRMDQIERRLFGRAYLNSFDVICAQTDEVAARLVSAGARREAVHVTGNLKFDAVMDPPSREQIVQRSPLLARLLALERPIIVAGCLSDQAELTMIVEAFEGVLERHPSALLVIAPRHPEVRQTLVQLEASLDGKGLRHCWRSRAGVAEALAGSQCMVLDSVGELRDFYAVAQLAHVGVNHNVLEPLGFGRPVTVQPGWETRYPSYAVYRLLMDKGVLAETGDALELAKRWSDWLSDDHGRHDATERIATQLKAFSGVTVRDLALLLGAARS